MSYISPANPRYVSAWFDSSTSGGSVTKGKVTGNDPNDDVLKWEVTYQNPEEMIWYSDADLLEILIPQKGEHVRWLEFDERYIGEVISIAPKMGDDFNAQQYNIKWRNYKVSKKEASESYVKYRVVNGRYLNLFHVLSTDSEHLRLGAAREAKQFTSVVTKNFRADVANWMVKTVQRVPMGTSILRSRDFDTEEIKKMCEERFKTLTTAYKGMAPFSASLERREAEKADEDTDDEDDEDESAIEKDVQMLLIGEVNRRGWTTIDRESRIPGHCIKRIRSMAMITTRDVNGNVRWAENLRYSDVKKGNKTIKSGWKTKIPKKKDDDLEKDVIYYLIHRKIVQTGELLTLSSFLGSRVHERIAELVKKKKKGGHEPRRDRLKRSLKLELSGILDETDMMNTEVDNAVDKAVDTVDPPTMNSTTDPKEADLLVETFKESLVVLDEWINDRAKALHTALEKEDIEVLETELVVMDTYHGYGSKHQKNEFMESRVDFIGVRSNGSIVLGDFKTQIGNGTQHKILQAQQLRQVMWYAWLLMINYHVVVDEVALFYVNRSSQTVFCSVTLDEKCYECFAHCAFPKNAIYFDQHVLVRRDILEPDRSVIAKLPTETTSARSSTRKRTPTAKYNAGQQPCKATLTRVYDYLQVIGRRTTTLKAARVFDAVDWRGVQSKTKRIEQSMYPNFTLTPLDGGIYAWGTMSLESPVAPIQFEHNAARYIYPSIGTIYPGRRDFCKDDDPYELNSHHEIRLEFHRSVQKTVDLLHSTFNQESSVYATIYPEITISLNDPYAAKATLFRVFHRRLHWLFREKLRAANGFSTGHGPLPDQDTLLQKGDTPPYDERRFEEFNVNSKRVAWTPTQFKWVSFNLVPLVRDEIKKRLTRSLQTAIRTET